MQDIRKPYTRSRSNNDLHSRLEQFHSARSKKEEYDEDTVYIPVRNNKNKDDEIYRRKRDFDGIHEDKNELDYDLDEYESSRNQIKPKPKIRKKISWQTISFILGFALLIVGVILYTYVFDSATITITPKYKDISSLNKVLVFSKNKEDVNAIPFIVETTSLSKSKALTLSETKKIDSKAQGKAIVYNNHDNNPQKLIKNTRFLSSEGYVYRINQSVEVPGKKGDTPGSVEVTLYADGVGAKYNINNTSFTIPGFKGTEREKTFYAKSKGPISGGSSGNVSLASIADLNAVKDSLALELSKEMESSILKINKDGYIPMYKAYEISYEDNEEEILKGLADTYKVTATGHLMLADASKLANAIAKTLGDYDDAPVRLDKINDLIFTRKQSEHITGPSSISILVDGNVRIIWDTNNDSIKELVKGEKRDNFKSLMKTISSIESAEIDFSPLWLSSFPSEISKIKIQESFGKH